MTIAEESEVVLKKILFVTNIPSPYRVDFYNELGKSVDLTVIFEAKSANNHGIRFNYNLDNITNFKAVFLSEEDIHEKKVNLKVFKQLHPSTYDEIVLTSYSYLTEMAALIYLKVIGRKFYFETDGGFIKIENRLKKYFKKILISSAYRYFSPSRLSDDYLVHYGASKQDIIRYPFTSLSEADISIGASMRTATSKYRAKLHMSDRINILFAGQFIERKGVDILLKAFNQIHDSKVHLYLVGGDGSEQYRGLISEAKKNRVHFVPFLSKDELREYYAAADIFCLPTREDIWGLVINEAMSFGLPIVTTYNCGAGVELVGNNGFLYDAENIQTLKICLTDLIENREKRRVMGEISLRKIRQYTIENMAHAHLSEVDA